MDGVGLRAGFDARARHRPRRSAVARGGLVRAGALMMAPASIPWETLAICLLLLGAPAIAAPRHARGWHLSGVALSLLVALVSGDGSTAYLAIGAGKLFHAARA